MKYYNLYINFEDSFDTYNAVTEIIGVLPAKKNPSKINTKLHDTWWYQVVKKENDSPFDFINIFLGLIETNFNKLAELNIKKTDILIWLIYEYEEQCSMEFHPQEMKRLGESGIAFNIDCFKTSVN